MFTRRSLFGLFAAAPVAALAKPDAKFATGGVVAPRDLPLMGEAVVHVHGGGFIVPAEMEAMMRAAIEQHCAQIQRKLPAMMAHAQGRYGA